MYFIELFPKKITKCLIRFQIFRIMKKQIIVMNVFVQRKDAVNKGVLVLLQSTNYVSSASVVMVVSRRKTFLCPDKILVSNRILNKKKEN